MLWEHDGDMHHAWEDDDLTAEGAADAKRAELGPNHNIAVGSRAVIVSGERCVVVKSWFVLISLNY